MLALFLGMVFAGPTSGFDRAWDAQSSLPNGTFLSSFRPYWYEITTSVPGRPELESVDFVFWRHYVAPRPFEAVIGQAKPTFDPQLWETYNKNYMVTSTYTNPPSRYKGPPKGIIFVGQKGTIYDGLSVQVNRDWGPDPKAKYEAPGYLGPRKGWTTVILRAHGRPIDVPLIRQTFQYVLGDLR